MVTAVGHRHSAMRKKKPVIKKFKNMLIRQKLNDVSQVIELHCFAASNLQNFYEKWANITTNTLILSTVKHDLRIDFTERQTQIKYHMVIKT